MTIFQNEYLDPPSLLPYNFQSKKYPLGDGQPLMIDQRQKQRFKQGFKQGLKKGVKQGFKQGFKQGLKQGFKQGFKQGLKQGFKQGVKQGGNYLIENVKSNEYIQYQIRSNIYKNN